MFKKVIFSSLLSCIFATSSYATSNTDLSSNKFAQNLQNAFSEVLSTKQEIGKKVTLNVLKPGDRNIRVSIKNGTCDDYFNVGFRVEKMSEELLIRTYGSYSEEQKNIVISFASRVNQGAWNASQKKGCFKK